MVIRGLWDSREDIDRSPIHIHYRYFFQASVSTISDIHTDINEILLLSFQYDLQGEEDYFTSNNWNFDFLN